MITFSLDLFIFVVYHQCSKDYTGYGKRRRKSGPTFAYLMVLSLVNQTSDHVQLTDISQITIQSRSILELLCVAFFTPIIFVRMLLIGFQDKGCDHIPATGIRARERTPVSAQLLR